MRISRQIASIVAVALLAGCGGGSSSPIAPTQARSSQQPAAGSPAGKARNVSVTFTIGKSRKGLKVVRASKSREYISPGTEGAVVTAVSAASPSPIASNNATYGYDLTDPAAAPVPSASPSASASPVASTTTCVDDTSGGGRTCTLVFPLNPDTYNITVTTYDTAQTNASASAPTGEPLSTQTLTNQTVSANATNSFSFQLGAYVEGFITLGSTGTTHFGLVGAVGGVVGPTGSTGSTGPAGQTPSVTLAALDPDGYQIDQYATTDYPYANPASVSIQTGTDSDATGCSTASPCVTAMPGTIESPIPSEQTASTSTLASNDDETLHYTYNGGGGVGTYVTNATLPLASPDPASSPTRPYYVGVSFQPAPVTGVSISSFTSFFVPLFGYAATTSGNSGSQLLVWAAQSSPPGGANYNDGSGYGALFPAAPAVMGSTQSNCYDGNGNVIMSVGSGTYEKFYGEAFVVTMGSFAGACTLMLSDGATTQAGVAAPDTVSLSLTNTSPSVTLTKPSPAASPLAPTGPSN